MQVFMTFLVAFFFAFFSVISLSSAAPMILEQRDVYTPPVTYPKTGTVWTVGSQHNVTWYVPLLLFLHSVPLLISMGSMKGHFQRSQTNYKFHWPNLPPPGRRDSVKRARVRLQHS